MERIMLNEALKIMDQCRYQNSKESFSILFMKCDRKRKVGGDFKTIQRAQICGLPFSVKDKAMRGVVDLDSGMKSSFHNHLVFEVNGKKIYK